MQESSLAANHQGILAMLLAVRQLVCLRELRYPNYLAPIPQQHSKIFSSYDLELIMWLREPSSRMVKHSQAWTIGGLTEG